jgi:hypothetical protein
VGLASKPRAGGLLGFEVGEEAFCQTWSILLAKRLVRLAIEVVVSILDKMVSAMTKTVKRQK